MRARLIVALALAANACSAGPDEPEPEASARCDPSLAAPATTPALEVLREDLAGGYAALVDGALLTRHHGPQGGSHFYVYARVFSPDASVWLVDARLSDAAAQSLAAGTRGFTACAAQWTQPREVTVFIEASGDLAGTLSVTAKPEQGTPLSFEAPITVGGG